MNEAFLPHGVDREPVLRIAVDQDPDGAATVRLSGDLDLDTVGELRRVLDSLLGRATSTDLTLDLSGLAFCDSAGVKTLLDYRARTAGLDRRFAVVDPRPNVLRVLEITGVTELLGLATEGTL